MKFWGSLTIVALAWVGLTAPSSWAGGVLFGKPTNPRLTLDTQRALAIWGPDNVKIEIAIHVTRAHAKFAWVIPVDPAPTLSLGDATLFDQLDEMTIPSVTLQGPSSGSVGACSSAKTPSRVVHPSSVSLLKGGVLGDYQHVALANDSADDVVKWLGDHGYAVPDGTAAALRPYAKRKMTFVVVTLTPPAQANGDVNPVPLVIESPRPAVGRVPFPLGVSALSAPAVTPVVLYVLGNARARVENYASADLIDVAKQIGSAYRATGSADYDQAVDTLTKSAGGRLFVTEFARNLNDSGLAPPSAISALMNAHDFFLTRLYARIPQTSLADAMVTVTPGGPEVHNAVNFDSNGSQAASFALLLLALAATVALGRRQAWHHAGLDSGRH